MMLQRMTLITWTRESSAIIDVFSLKVLFSITDHVTEPQRTVFFFFKCRFIHVHPRAYVCIINEKTKSKFPGKHEVV